LQCEGIPATGALTPGRIDPLAEAAYQAYPKPMLYESARYWAAADTDGNGTQPLFAYGLPRLVRLGIEFLF
jgi:hypothetical protein